jgi:hypothetical protein
MKPLADEYSEFRDGRLTSEEKDRILSGVVHCGRRKGREAIGIGGGTLVSWDACRARASLQSQMGNPE